MGRETYVRDSKGNFINTKNDDESKMRNFGCGCLIILILSLIGWILNLLGLVES